MSKSSSEYGLLHPLAESMQQPPEPAPPEPTPVEPTPVEQPAGESPTADNDETDPLAETSLSRRQQLHLYRYMQLNRLVEDRLSNLYRQNKVVGGLYGSRGQEAVSVGSAFALEPQDFIGPLIRNLGSMLVRGVEPREVFTQYMARGTSPTGGKDCNLHFGDVRRGMIAPISMLGALIPVMAGVALAGERQGKKLVAMTWIGDGGTSTGDFHEGLNLAAVLNLPLVVIAEHNGYAYSTPTSMQMRIENIADRAVGYGIPGSIIDGNDVLAVYNGVKRAVDRARAGDGPSLVEVKTFRMKGHAEHDDAGYVPRELLDQWARRDPIERFERHLLHHRLASPEDLEAITTTIRESLDVEVDFALASEMPPPERSLEGVYAEAPPEVAVAWRPQR